MFEAACIPQFTCPPSFGEPLQFGLELTVFGLRSTCQKSNISSLLFCGSSVFSENLKGAGLIFIGLLHLELAQDVCAVLYFSGH